MTTPTIDPFTTVPFEQLPAGPARIEILERHSGPDRYGDNVLICPNQIRINGVALWCSADKPVEVKAIRVNDAGPRALEVTMRLQTRRLSLGEEPTRVVPDAPNPKTRFATVELPPEQADILGPDGSMSPAYVIVNGHKLLLAGDGVKIDPVFLDGDAPNRVAVAEVSLLCRSVVFDDIVQDGAPAPAEAFGA